MEPGTYKLKDLPEEVALAIPPEYYDTVKGCTLCKGSSVFAGKVCKCVTVTFPLPEDVGICKACGKPNPLERGYCSLCDFPIGLN
jgi:hypothetical protein